MAAKISAILLACILVYTSCTYTKTKSKTPVLKNISELNKRLSGLIAAENVNIDGKEITQDNKTTSELEISITNAKNLPQEDDLKRILARLLAKAVKANLKDTSAYNDYQVFFIHKTENAVITKRNWISYTLSSEEVSSPDLEVGKLITREKGYTYGGSSFTSKDSNMIFILRDYTFIDTSSVFMQISRQKQDDQEIVANGKVGLYPHDNYLSQTIKVSEFIANYGTGKFIFKVVTHDSLIASKSFEVNN